MSKERNQIGFFGFERQPPNEEVKSEDLMETKDFSFFTDGSGIPAQFAWPPLRLPGSSPDQLKVNQIFQKSMAVQMGLSPFVAKPPEGMKYTCFSLEITGLLFLYLKELGIDAKLKIGHQETPGDDADLGGWLEIDGFIIDNVFRYHFPRSGQKDFFSRRMNAKYEEEDLDDLYQQMQIIFQKPSLSISTNADRLKVYGKPDTIEKYMAFWLKFSWASAIRFYDAMMRQFIKDKFDVKIEYVVAKWKNVCYGCQDVKADLKTCAGCMIAKYCSKNCQVSDRKMHKILDKMLAPAKAAALAKNKK